MSEYNKKETQKQRTNQWFPAGRGKGGGTQKWGNKRYKLLGVR